jgi:hypothetical protein
MRIIEGVNKYKDIVTLALTFIGIVGGLVGLSFLIVQTHALERQTLSLERQAEILSEEYEAAYRPYLAVEDIATQEGNDSSLKILINVRNYGQMPATKVDLEKVVIGGADVKYDEETGTYTFIYTGDDYVIALIDQDYPPDFIFFPGKEQIIIATVDKSIYQATVLETKLMHIALVYSYGLERYYYVAKANLQDGIWTVVENRGN